MLTTTAKNLRSVLQIQNVLLATRLQETVADGEEVGQQPVSLMLPVPTGAALMHNAMSVNFPGLPVVIPGGPMMIV